VRQYKGISPGSLPPTNAPDFTQRLRNMLASIDNYLHDTGKGFSRIDVGLVPQGSGSAIPFRASVVSNETGNLTASGTITAAAVVTTSLNVSSTFILGSTGNQGDVLTCNTPTGINYGIWQAPAVTLNSPTFTGTPAAPTAAFGTSTTQLATTAFVQGAAQAMFALTTNDTNASAGTGDVDITNAGGSGSAALGTMVAGGTVRVTIGGIMGNAGLGETLTIKLKHGSTTVLTTGAMAIAAFIPTSWVASAILTWRSGTTVVGSGLVQLTDGAWNGNLAGQWNTGAAAVTVATTGTLSITATWSTSSAANTITALTCVMEQIR